RPAPPPLASGNHLDPLSRGSHMTTLMIAPYRTLALDRRMLAVHAKPSAHRPRSGQGVLSTPLTVPTKRRLVFLAATAVVPLPRNGSTTTPPGGQSSLIIHSANSVGYWAGWV